MPENQSNKVEVNWDLYDLDHDELWQPQFPIENVDTTVGGVLAEQPRFGFQDAIMNWVQGKSKTVSFETVLFARDEDEGDIVQEQQEALEALATKDDELGRPPICIFSLGSALSEVCLIESVDPTIVSTLRNGQAREVRFRIVLRRYVPFSQQQIDPTKPVKESSLLVASAAEQSYEAIAKREAWKSPAEARGGVVNDVSVHPELVRAAESRRSPRVGSEKQGTPENAAQSICRSLTVSPCWRSIRHRLLA